MRDNWKKMCEKKMKKKKSKRIKRKKKENKKAGQLASRLYNYIKVNKETFVARTMLLL